MIIRENKINPKSEHVKFSVSFGSADIKRFVRMYIDTITMNYPDLLLSIKSWNITEHEIRHWMESDLRVFANIENPWRTQLSAWAWAHIVSENYVIPSATHEDRFIFAEKCFIRPGRPKGT